MSQHEQLQQAERVGRAHQEGFACGSRTLVGWLGAGSGRNPYPAGTAEHKAWNTGFAESRGYRR